MGHCSKCGLEAELSLRRCERCRFLAHVSIAPDGCWLSDSSSWGDMGYGQFSFNGYRRAAHRAAWEIFKGSIPDKTLVLHTCDVPNCVNPDHLFLGTQLDNMRDMLAKGRRPHVPSFGQKAGESNINAKLNDGLVRYLRTDKGGKELLSIASRLQVSPATLRRARYGHSWKHVT